MYRLKGSIHFTAQEGPAILLLRRGFRINGTYFHKDTWVRRGFSEESNIQHMKLKNFQTHRISITHKIAKKHHTLHQLPDYAGCDSSMRSRSPQPQPRGWDAYWNFTLRHFFLIVAQGQASSRMRKVHRVCAKRVLKTRCILVKRWQIITTKWWQIKHNKQRQDVKRNTIQMPPYWRMHTYLQ